MYEPRGAACKSFSSSLTGIGYFAHGRWKEYLQTDRG